VKNKDGTSEARRTSDIENQVAQAILDIQNNADAANKEALMKLYITGVKEFDVGGKNAIVISIPPPQVKQWQAVQTKTTRELEKKFSGKHVIFVGSRKSCRKKLEKPVPNVTNRSVPFLGQSLQSMKRPLPISVTRLR